MRWFSGVFFIAILCSGSVALSEEPLQATTTDAGQASETASPQSKISKKAITDAEVIAAIIAASRAAYLASGPGPCGCPDDIDRAGRRCGRRSAHDRSGGWDVLCTPHDVTPEMVKSFREGQAN